MNYSIVEGLGIFLVVTLGIFLKLFLTTRIEAARTKIKHNLILKSSIRDLVQNLRGSSYLCINYHLVYFLGNILLATILMDDSQNIAAVLITALYIVHIAMKSLVSEFGRHNDKIALIATQVIVILIASQLVLTGPLQVGFVAIVIASFVIIGANNGLITTNNWVARSAADIAHRLIATFVLFWLNIFFLKTINITSNAIVVFAMGISTAIIFEIVFNGIFAPIMQKRDIKKSTIILFSLGLCLFSLPFIMMKIGQYQ